MSKHFTRAFVFAILSLGFLVPLTLTGCVVQDDDSAVEEALEDTGDAIEDAGDDIEDAIDDAGGSH